MDNRALERMFKKKGLRTFVSRLRFMLEDMGVNKFRPEMTRGTYTPDILQQIPTQVIRRVYDSTCSVYLSGGRGRFGR